MNSSPNPTIETGYRELMINNIFFTRHGEIQDRFKSHKGISYLCKLLDSIDDKNDLWLIMELCGKPLSKRMFEVKGEFYRGERIYSVIHKQDAYQNLEGENCLKFKELISGLAHVLDLFSQAGIVHSDLKPENILLSSESNGPIFKVIDFGSSFPL